ncbi:hypothetical protein [Desulforamulus ruminis]|uniref:Abortive infection protein n=1 Tax=Desulforamulus ruminis (strain ATCC 23193 / DSM 2154 / NCIMB 8452 / DL) TaxID=696281 RepID=F6DMS1_DESRL|nr:hypothetical protein [Desulforamulus ruminis]AEG58479.1 hypothetical protein Desru_0180 [Desulforamulus ruminis DSM 2154]
MPEIIFSLAAALLAAGLAWLANGLILPAAGNRGIALLTPLVEETVKTLTAVILETSILWTHVFFGLLEALVEIIRRGVAGLAPGCAALAAHSLFGLLTVWIYGQFGLVPSLALAYLAHAAWNGVVVAVNRNKPGS